MRKKKNAVKSAKKKETKLNADIPVELKVQLDVFCAQNNVYIKDVVAEAIKQHILKHSA
ncbi:hypothetical protein [Bacillus mycoides]|uniref:hypothetical protein n=1 Tax=Bacillus mycoides TaxID=1405 RepID=UPI001C02CF91|nr:hypothetical protein [Bacillus mycoides]